MILLGDINVTTGNDRGGYDTHVGLMAFGQAPRLCDKSQVQYESWVQKPDLHHCTLYCNGGSAVRDICHILVCGRSRPVKNCRVFRSTDFAGTNHRLLVATFKITLKSRGMASSLQELAESFGELKDSDDPEELCNEFETSNPKVS